MVLYGQAKPRTTFFMYRTGESDRCKYFSTVVVRAIRTKSAKGAQ